MKIQIDHVKPSERMNGLSNEKPAPVLSALCFLVIVSTSVTLNDMPHMNPNTFTTASLGIEAQPYTPPINPICPPGQCLTGARSLGFGIGIRN